MPTCDMGYDHDGQAAENEPEPPVIIDPGPNENDVRIAEIEAEASIKREQIYTEQQALDLAAENERLRGENAGMKEILDRVVPEPAPAPEVVPVPVPASAAPEVESTPAPPETQEAPTKKKKGGFWGDNY